MSAPADSAASSSPSGPDAPAPEIAARWSRNSLTGSANSVSPPSSSRSNRALGPSGVENAVAAWSQLVGSDRASSDCELSAERRRMVCASRRSTQRSTRTPAVSSAGYHRAVSSQTQRAPSRSKRSTVTANSARPTITLPGKAAPSSESGMRATPAGSERRTTCTVLVCRVPPTSMRVPGMRRLVPAQAETLWMLLHERFCSLHQTGSDHKADTLGCLDREPTAAPFDHIHGQVGVAPVLELFA